MVICKILQPLFRVHLKIKILCTTWSSAKFKDYKGHAEHVIKVRFSHDGTKVFSVGGLDKAVMQFDVKAPPPTAPAK